MNGQCVIIVLPAAFAGETGVIVDDNYRNSKLMIIRFDRFHTTAVFHRNELKILPVMAKAR